MKFARVPAMGTVLPASAYVSMDGRFRIEPGWYIGERDNVRRSGWEVVRGLDVPAWTKTLSEAKALCEADET